MTEHTSRARRVAQQQLQSLQRAGLTHWPRPIVPVEAVASPKHEQPAVPPAATAATVQPAPTACSALFSEAAATPSPQIPAPPMEKSTLSRTEREQRLEALRERVAVCTRCAELARTRTRTVFGVGSPEAKILFIGEAPGADEDRLGEPFVGRAGQLLNDIIRACKLKREDIYICNILRCRPPGNRTPTPREAENCREYLLGQIETVDPDYIVCWGSVAARNLLGLADPIGKLRGRLFTFGRAKVLCTYHPSYLLRNPAAKRDVWEDMKFLFRDMGITLTGK